LEIFSAGMTMYQIDRYQLLVIAELTAKEFISMPGLYDCLGLAISGKKKSKTINLVTHILPKRIVNTLPSIMQQIKTLGLTDLKVAAAATEEDIDVLEMIFKPDSVLFMHKRNYYDIVRPVSFMVERNRFEISSDTGRSIYSGAFYENIRPDRRLDGGKRKNPADRSSYQEFIGLCFDNPYSDFKSGWLALSSERDLRIREENLKALMPRVSCREKVIVLGQGESPVRQLAEAFDRVVLVDLDAEALENSCRDLPLDRLNRTSKRVLDISGMAKKFAKLIGNLSTAYKNKFLNAAELNRRYIALLNDDNLYAQARIGRFPENSFDLVLSERIYSELPLSLLYYAHYYLPLSAAVKQAEILFQDKIRERFIFNLSHLVREDGMIYFADSFLGEEKEGRWVTFVDGDIDNHSRKAGLVELKGLLPHTEWEWGNDYYKFPMQAKVYCTSRFAPDGGSKNDNVFTEEAWTRRQIKKLGATVGLKSDEFMAYLLRIFLRKKVKIIWTTIKRKNQELFRKVMAQIKSIGESKSRVAQTESNINELESIISGISLDGGMAHNLEKQVSALQLFPAQI
jgi:hypothetical protein